MNKNGLAALAAGLLATGVGSLSAQASAAGAASAHPAATERAPGMNFRRIATLANYRNNGPDRFGDSTVSEIVAATRDGRTLVYTDSELEQIGFVDIGDPRNPQPAGTLAMPGEPTSVDVLGNAYALVAVNTSADYVDVGGQLVVVDVATRTVLRTIDLGGQPDSLKVSPDGRYAAVAIENERDEDVTVGDVEGGLPQAPAGYLAIIDLVGSPAAWQRRDVDLRGLSAYAPQDPEPEFVDVNDRNEAVVTLQENNHVAIVDLASGRVTSHFSAGSVSLDDVDAVEDDRIVLQDSLAGIAREPDAVAWVRNGRQGEHFIATANEGDLFGGSRGFSLFNRRGQALFDSGNTLEWIAVRHGHYPEGRSENKGSEPESVEAGTFGKRDYLFVGSERGSFVAVYEVDGASPKFKQLLPGPFGPEGLLAIPSRNLLVASGEEDAGDYGVRSTLMIYELQAAAPSYPQILSANAAGAPIPWSALSGMVAVPGAGSELLAVWDSYYSESRVFRIDASRMPAVITAATTVQGGRGGYDPEGIAIAPDGTHWLASEGNGSDSRPNLLVQLDSLGQVIREVSLPDAVLACRKSSTSRGTLGSGYEGVAVLPTDDGYRLLVAQQRGWNYTAAGCEDLDDDGGGLNARGEPNWSRIWVYEPDADRWSHVAWELAPLPDNSSWVGLSEITRAPDGSYLVLERDNRTGDFAGLKTLVRIDWDAATADGVVRDDEKSVHDLVPHLRATRGWITDKPEGVAVTDSGRTFVVTDNDGVDDWSGETWFLGLGDVRSLFD